MNHRNHLTVLDIERLISATHGSPTAARDRCLIYLMSDQGLRLSEVCSLEVEHVDLAKRELQVPHYKLAMTPLAEGYIATHPLQSDHVHTLEVWLKERARLAPEGDALFVSEEGLPLNGRAISDAIKLCGRVAGFDFELHPSMLRIARARESSCTPALHNFLTRPLSIRMTMFYIGKGPLPRASS
jgi:site-specific recombinase XerC